MTIHWKATVAALILCLGSANAYPASRHRKGDATPKAPESVKAPPPAFTTPAPIIPRWVLEQSWARYKAYFIQSDGRVIDRKGGGVSTSEGQAYAMLRSVWMNDASTFQAVLNWADTNLRLNARNDALFGWRWGQREDGSWGLLDVNAATDADQLMAYSLILGYRRFKNPLYLKRARHLLTSIWEREVSEIKGRHYVLPGDWSNPKDGTPIRLNPSYYMPFAYRLFAEVDPMRPWANLVDTSYRVIGACRSRVGIPTDWCELDPESGGISVSVDLQDSSSDFGFEAFRVLWNLAADYHWYQEPRALKALSSMSWLRRFWVVRRELPSVITIDGIPRTPAPYLGVYGAFLPALALMDPMEADVLYNHAIQPTFKDGLWGEPDDYYAQNWIFFGLALQSTLHTSPKP